MDMDWQDKAAALDALSEISIKFRPKQDRIGGTEPWYISQSIEVKDGAILSGAYGNGETPIAAIIDHWRQLVDEIPPHKYLVVYAMSNKRRRAVRWNGFMWEEIHE